MFFGHGLDPNKGRERVREAFQIKKDLVWRLLLAELFPFCIEDSHDDDRFKTFIVDGRT